MEETYSRYISVINVGLIQVLAEVSKARYAEEKHVELEQESFLVLWLVRIIPRISL